MKNLMKLVIVLAISVTIFSFMGSCVKFDTNGKSETITEVSEKIELSAQKSGLNLSIFSEKEINVITAAAKRNNLNKDLYSILFAIRKAENGKAGREFGILNPKCDAQIKKNPKNSLDIQAGWCASTIQKNYNRWKSAGKPNDFISYLGSVYCPVGASNDPKGLNKNWIKNVKKWVDKIES